MQYQFERNRPYFSLAMIVPVSQNTRIQRTLYPMPQDLSYSAVSKRKKQQQGFHNGFSGVPFSFCPDFSGLAPINISHPPGIYHSTESSKVIPFPKSDKVQVIEIDKEDDEPFPTVVTSSSPAVLGLKPSCLKLVLPQKTLSDARAPSKKIQPERPRSLQDIPQCPTIQLKDKDMQGDPVGFFRELEDKYREFGAVKLIASEGWNPPFTFRYVDKGITTRIQVLQHLAQGKPFEQKIEAYSIKAFENYARTFDLQYKYKTNPQGSNTEQKNQQEFWDLVSNPLYKDYKVSVQYAADLPVSRYGSGFPTSSTSFKDADFQYETNMFNINNIYRSPNCPLKILDLDGKKQKISGVTSPWVYMGMKFASFCWHVEDLYINSINYNHKGATKTWYVVPARDKQKFDSYVMNRYAKQCQAKPDFLHRITLMINPLDLMEHGIQVYKVNQQQRCYVLTFSKVYHAGFSHGFNIGEAVNYMSYHSFGVVKEAYREYEKCMGKKMAIFPLEWLVYEGYLNRDRFINEDPIYRKKMIQSEYRDLKRIVESFPVLEYQYFEKKNLKYDKNPCSLCKNYCYLSVLRCLGCKKAYCLSHVKTCCRDSNLRLLLREPNEERQRVLKLLHKATHILQ